MVGYGVLVSDAQAPGLAKRFDQSHDVRLRGGFAGERAQMAHQGLLALRAVVDVLAQVFQNAGQQVFRRSGWRFGRGPEMVRG